MNEQAIEIMLMSAGIIVSVLAGIGFVIPLNKRFYSVFRSIAIAIATVAMFTAGVAVYQLIQYDAQYTGRFVDSNGLMRSNAEADVKCRVAVMLLGEKIAAATNPPPIPDDLPSAIYHRCLYLHNRFI